MVLEVNRLNIKKAVRVLHEGGIIIYPTESSYGMGCDFTNKNAVERVNLIKNRLKNKHNTVIVDSLETAKKYTKLCEKETKLANKFMPGPLTLVTKGKNGAEFNFRISSHPVAGKLARLFGKPIIATSANNSGHPAIYDSADLHNFFGRVDIILDYGDLPKREASTVVAVSPRFRKIREGAIKIDTIKSSLKRM